MRIINSYMLRVQNVFGDIDKYFVLKGPPKLGHHE